VRRRVHFALIELKFLAYAFDFSESRSILRGNPK
jgi:hypothetical protein